jgi:serine/threonine-protein kinase
MKPTEWHLVDELFAGAVSLPPVERDRYLRERCDGDDALRQRVESLIAAAHERGGLLSAAVAHAVLASAEPLNARAGQRVGPYLLVRELGRGGMGAVYLAERDDGEFEGRVAIKMMLGHHTPELVRRFNAERRILARLEHPNIARLYDAGTSADGVPYVVMEHVDGEPIDAYCTRLALATADRVRLFRTVCDAVQYAHAHLIVHRDLKPGNILVTRDGTVKLLDFGIAKLLDDGAAGASIETQVGFRLMTPRYASPEQARGGVIATASDVYSLGVVLFELLTGALPYAVPSHPSSEVERVITEELPPRPSTLPGVSERVRRELRGDLDVIVLAALRKEAARRYASAGELGEDLRRHVDGMPVRARPDTVRYRTGKFVRRHRPAVAAIAAGFVAVASLVAFYTARLARQRDLARVEAEKAEQVSSFVIGLFEVSNPSRARGETITARELLDSSARRVRDALADQPEVRATMMGVMGRVYSNLALYAEAAPLLEEALALRRSHLGPIHEDVAGSATSLAGNLYSTGDYERAEELHREALRIQRALHRGDHADLVGAMENLGHFLARKGDLAAADTLYRDALAMHRRLPANDGRLASLLDGYAFVLDALGDYDGSEAKHRESVALVERRMRGDSLILGVALNNLANVLSTKGNFVEAEPMLRRSLAISRVYYGNDHPDVGASLTNLGRVLRNTGRLEEAEELFRESLRIAELRQGAEHPDVATDLGFLAGILVERGQLADAEALQRRAVAIRRKGLGAQHAYVAMSLNELAGSLHRQGKLDEAEAVFREGLEIRRRAYQPGHPYTAYSLVGLGGLLLERGRTAQAEPLLREALEIRERALPVGDVRTAEARSLRGAALVGLGRDAEGERELLAAHDVMRKERPAGDRLREESRRRLVEVYEARGERERARAVPPLI